MRASHPTHSRWLASALAVAGACAGLPTNGAHAATPAAMRLERLIGMASCSSDAQCRTVPVGTRACGGPERYLAWSVRETRAAELTCAIAEAGNQAAPALPGGAMSTCEIVPDPGAHCQRLAVNAAWGRCVLRPLTQPPVYGPPGLPTR